MKGIALVWFSAILCFADSVTVDPSKFPVPPQSKKSLFYIHRSTNPNTVVYEVNLNESNTIDAEEPVNVYWIRYGEKGQQRGLNYLERTFAYGVKSEPLDQTRYTVEFVASKARTMEVSLDKNGQAHAILTIHGQEARLTKIFVQVAEDGWWPRIAYIEFFGLDRKTNKTVYEKMQIN